MSAVVFIGPTISREEVASMIDAVCLPPVSQGDIYRVSRQKPRAIGIVDGYFQGVPSVWHKEILWAMAEGIPVFGSASMGALRAAELHAFGMQGVGRIFADYRDGRLLDDDEVAVVHAPQEAGFEPLSEPMVNIRATVERASSQHVIGEETAKTLRRLAKALHYEERNWDGLLVQARSVGLPAPELDAFAEWLPEGRLDLKHEDALAMLASMRELLETEATPAPVSYDFEWTDMWDQVTARWLTAPSDRGEAMGVETARVLDELRLEEERFRDAKQQALNRFLALREAERRKVRVTREAHRDKITEHRGARGLYPRQVLDDWLVQNQMEAFELEDLMYDEARVEAVSALTGAALSDQLHSQLKLSGDFAGLADRAREKREALSALGLADAEPADTGKTPIGLVDWYFRERCGRPMPEDLDAYVRDLGLSSRADFYRILAREYLYSICQ